MPMSLLEDTSILEGLSSEEDPLIDVFKCFKISVSSEFITEVETNRTTAKLNQLKRSPKWLVSWGNWAHTTTAAKLPDINITQASRRSFCEFLTMKDRLRELIVG